MEHSVRNFRNMEFLHYEQANCREQLVCLNKLPEAEQLEYAGLKIYIEKRLRDFCTTKQKLYILLEQVENPVDYTVLNLRYFCGYGWEEIAERMDYSLRHVQRIHNRALKALTPLLPQ